MTAHSQIERTPLGCTGFDMDLLTLFPDLPGEPAVARASEISLWVLGSTSDHNGAEHFSHPTCWNIHEGLAGFAFTRPTALPYKDGWNCLPGSCHYVTSDREHHLSAFDLVRQSWIGHVRVLLDWRMWLVPPLEHELFMPIMYHQRGWHKRTNVESLKVRARHWVILACERGLTLLREGQAHEPP